MQRRTRIQLYDKPPQKSSDTQPKAAETFSFDVSESTTTAFPAANPTAHQDSQSHGSALSSSKGILPTGKNGGEHAAYSTRSPETFPPDLAALDATISPALNSPTVTAPFPNQSASPSSSGILVNRPGSAGIVYTPTEQFTAALNSINAALGSPVASAPAPPAPPASAPAPPATPASKWRFQKLTPQMTTSPFSSSQVSIPIGRNSSIFTAGENGDSSSACPSRFVLPFGSSNCNQQAVQDISSTSSEAQNPPLTPNSQSNGDVSTSSCTDLPIQNQHVNLSIRDPTPNGIGPLMDTACGGSANAALPYGGFFHHEIVPFRAGSVTLNGDKFFLGNSTVPIKATQEVIDLRRIWETEKANYDRKMQALSRKRMNSQFHLVIDRDNAIPEHYIPQMLPRDEKELFADVEKHETGRLIDDCMEQATQCVFLGLDNPAPAPPAPVECVQTLNLPRQLRANLEKMHIDDLLPVQRQVIPLIRSGSDVIATSPTGTGKTIAFLVPIIEAVLTRKNKNPLADHVTQALILCPTRELAVQLHEAATRLAFGTDVTSWAVYGAIDSNLMRKQLRIAPDIIIATPGRMLDLISGDEKLISMQHLRFVVIDEVDRMMTGRSFPEIPKILDHPTFPAPKMRQMLYFSATISKDEMVFLKSRQAHPFSVQVGTTGLSLGMSHIFEKTAGYFEKVDKLRHYLDLAVIAKESVIVFAGSKNMVDRLHENLRGFSYLVTHGNLTQSNRADVLRQFASGEVTIMVATDLCSRGLDIDAVNTVINFNMPRDAADYIHRTGRSGRKGHEGTAVTFFDPSYWRDGRALEAVTMRLKESGISLPTWLVGEVNEIRHARINSGRQTIGEPEAVDETAEDLADLGIFDIRGCTTVPVITCEWLRELC
ncbi:DEAD-box ATP-dependent RNA helicase 52C [Hypsibius exemplaris]|uniref:DEAD-box ATP-dependent RNA helicase 52C n=1 Tax=Hypsibius exemplaris TaxID=2072580 RepID=A0A1W0XD16_HYPEX|nr:DEAD-box ATP-dependent RNA helicase 52C [Hypsibius exemplaris]